MRRCGALPLASQLVAMLASVTRHAHGAGAAQKTKLPIAREAGGASGGVCGPESERGAQKPKPPEARGGLQSQSEERPVATLLGAPMGEDNVSFGLHYRILRDPIPLSLVVASITPIEASGREYSVLAKT